MRLVCGCGREKSRAEREQTMLRVWGSGQYADPAEALVPGKGVTAMEASTDLTDVETHDYSFSYHRHRITSWLVEGGHSFPASANRRQSGDRDNACVRRQRRDHGLFRQGNEGACGAFPRR